MLLLSPFLLWLYLVQHPPIYIFLSVFLCPMCIHLYFPKFSSIYHCSDHLTNWSRSSCQLCLSVSFVTFLNTFVLSANFSTFSTLNTFVLSANLSNLLDMSSSKSFIYYIKNSIGPNTDPCGKKVIPQALRLRKPWRLIWPVLQPGFCSAKQLRVQLYWLSWTGH